MGQATKDQPLIKCIKCNAYMCKSCIVKCIVCPFNCHEIDQPKTDLVGNAVRYKYGHLRELDYASSGGLSIWLV